VFLRTTAKADRLADLSGQEADSFLEPGFAAVFAVFIAESIFQHPRFPVRTNALRDDQHAQENP
jgi:hypothetical protein